MTPLDPSTHSYWTHSSGCPRLFLAPMEGLGDGFFRRALATIGGFDEACTEFLRVPKNAHCVSLAKRYLSRETFPIPQAAQIMGYDLELCAEMAQELVKRGAPRIDLNCGCPSNTVTGRGAGSSLLKDPEHLHLLLKSLVKSVSVPVTAKLRAGFSDTSLFKENLLAAQEAGIAYLTLHPRTKVEGYALPSHWERLTEAKQILRIPLVGSGDICSVEQALQMLEQTKVDGLMIGRGAVMDPWIFHKIKAHFSQTLPPGTWEETEQYVRVFAQEIRDAMKPRSQINKLKQLVRFLYKGLHIDPKTILTSKETDPSLFLEDLLMNVKKF